MSAAQRHALAIQQTALLDLLYLKTPDLIALRADSMPASGHFCFKNAALTVRGLRAYRANAQVLSSNVLQACYPALQQLLGEENFQNLAQDFWQELPPVRGDLAQWGGELPEYLSQVPQLQALLLEHAFLPDVALVEWALHSAATATDAQLDASSFQLLASHDPAKLCLVLSPGCAVLRSAYPVVALVQLNETRAALVHDARAAGVQDTRVSEAHEAAREAARASIASGRPQNALVWRRGFVPMLGVAAAASAALIKAALQGQSLVAAVDAALAQTPDFDLEAWLSASVQSGLLIGVRQCA